MEAPIRPRRHILQISKNHPIYTTYRVLGIFKRALEEQFNAEIEKVHETNAFFLEKLKKNN